MFRLDADRQVSFCDGLRRRDFLHAGSLATLGLSLTDWFGMRALGATGPPDTNCILLMLIGGPSQLDTFDMKPNAPVEIRGPYKPIKTNVPGIEISENFPRTAKHADKFSLIRSVYHTAAAVHDTGHQMMQTGRLFQGGIEHPHFGCVLSKLKGPKGDVPAHVLLPRPIGNTGGNMPHGQSAGYLGKSFDPFVLNADPSDPNFRVPDMLPPDYLTALRVDRRRNWREMVDKSVSEFETSQDARLLDSTFHQAYTLMSSQKAREAFELHREPEAVREKYGMNRFGQSCLLARRLIEAGVRFVTVNMFETVFDEITWDIHGSKPFSPISCYRDLVGPMFDMAYSSLLAELAERGLLSNTMVVATGEFGRTPKINPAGGRDHWPQCWSMLMGGGAIKGGTVVGSSDEIGAAPKDRPVTPAQIAATVYRGLGIDLAIELPGAQGRPIPLVDRGVEPIQELLRVKLLLCLVTLPLLAQKLAVLPPAVELTGPEARQQLLVEATVGEHQEDWTRAAEWSSADPKIAAVDEKGMVRPAQDGETRITARAKGQTATVVVRVKAAHAPFTWSFRNHVTPVMTKMGCNQGACHGALAGKNGFKLTLRGYDPQADYDTLTRQSVGRRVSLTEPAASLILAKPSFAIPHGGGKRFANDSLEYRVIQEWITAGAPPPAATDVQIRGLEVFPAAAVLAPEAEQQLVVRAGYSDGHTEDVTRWVKFSSSNEGVATVDDWGRVKMNGPGEAAITLYYSSRVLYARLSVPFPNQISADTYQKFPRRNFIDNLVVAKLQSLHLAPSKVADDATFLRRAYLDAAGILPTSEEVETFLADTAPDKRAKVVDGLLQREEFTDYWSYKWSDLLLVSTRRLNSTAMWAFYDWIRDSVKHNKPWDKFAKEIFLSAGSTRQNGALNYFVLHKDPIEISENATQAFLGQRIMCARCHNHPLEKWTQTQYYQMANLFARVGVKNGATAGENIVFAKASGDVLHPRLARPLPPTPLDGQSIALDSPEDRRVAFANWLAGPSNAMFARTIVNRVWANFMGRGLVDPVDDVRATNPASNEELFAALAKDFVDHGYDIQRLIRTIMDSSAYQLSSEANATNQADNIYYSKHIVRRLSGEVILDAMSQVTGSPTAFAGYPAGTRALQLPDTQVKSEFLSSFGRPPRILCDAAERSSDPTIAQALHVINGDTLNKKLSAPDGTVALFLKLGLSDRRILEHMYLSAFSRYPNVTERQTVAAALEKVKLTKGTEEARRDAHKQALEDMVWALLTSKEFLFNH